MSHMHHYYHTPGITDLQAMVDDANRRLTFKNEMSVVHNHTYSERCPGGCQEIKNEG